jgi:hypothetical protein
MLLLKLLKKSAIKKKFAYLPSFQIKSYRKLLIFSTQDQHPGSLYMGGG